MPMPVPDVSERQALLAYLQTLAPVTDPAAVPAASDQPASGPSLADWRGDDPGVRHHIALAELPPPYATASARNGPVVVPRPAPAHPKVPPGFRVDTFTQELSGPRLLRVSPSGDLFVAESFAGRVRAVRGADGARESPRNEVFSGGLDRPFGLAFYPPGPDPKWLYVAQTNSVVRFAYRNGDLVKRGNAQAVVPSLTHDSGGHWTRDVAFSNDGTQMFISVGSASNVAEGGTDEHERADVLAFDSEGRGRHVYASGLRNCVGMAVHPTTGDLWCSTNERDGLGDDLVPDYVTRVRRGGFYGWPWYYLGPHVDPRHPEAGPMPASSVLLPDLLLQAHSAPLAMTFYEGTAFPQKYWHGAFVALHGSWNRAKRTGPKVVFIPISGGAPTGEYEDFMTGFVVSDEEVWARPVGVAVARDGSLFISDDANGALWRVSYSGN
jgi:glucose/arabinose dehydrogenase